MCTKKIYVVELRIYFASVLCFILFVKYANTFCASNKFMFVVTLYGMQHMSFNCHLLVHLEQSVEHWGKLRATSCFRFDDTTGQLLSSFRGTHSVPHQIFKSYLANIDLVKLRTSFVNKAVHVVETFQTK